MNDDTEKRNSAPLSVVSGLAGLRSARVCHLTS
jgi:hypothetical protein